PRAESKVGARDESPLAALPLHTVHVHQNTGLAKHAWYEAVEPVRRIDHKQRVEPTTYHVYHGEEAMRRGTKNLAFNRRHPGQVYTAILTRVISIQRLPTIHGDFVTPFGESGRKAADKGLKAPKAPTREGHAAGAYDSDAHGPIANSGSR